ncbi:acyl-CoA dehydrogenase family protein, partial [Streptomyces griseolus]|uniref:acyl-CoA dehydrogenase family protein n=1 Tax=Streptomyces griseolus TaxID=1909 RepID=UPI002242D236
MDFSLGEELEAVRDLAREIFTDRATPERLREVETSPSRIDEHLWDLVASDAPGVNWRDAETTSHDMSAHLALDGVRAEAVGVPGDGAVAHLVRSAFVALAAVQTGVAEGALGYATGHLAQREQFGRPLATFQAVRHQLADCYIDIEAMRVTLWHAVDALADPFDARAADRAALVAKWWATE